MLLPRQRLQILALVAVVLVSDSVGQVAKPTRQRAPEPFTFASVQRVARERAAQPFRDHSSPLPESLANVSYDEYRDIHFRAENALWRGLSLFEVQFFHRGFNFNRQVRINEVSDSGVRAIPYEPSQFDFGHTSLPAKDLTPDLGFAGFRVHYPLNSPTYKDELIVFLGASYFRVLGRGQVYGLSARGLAVNTATAGGEEFPWFTDFWLVRPQPNQTTLRIYAVLDSDSVTGAFQFDIRPGSVTQVEVTSEFYPRRNIEKLGIAPLTSMYLYGEDRPRAQRFDDFRPEVHDSDGLMALTGRGEWLWRPLVNPHDLTVSRLMDRTPRGFGLVQRDRNFDHYEDTESQFNRRPSYRIEPRGDWGEGGVELVQLPADEEVNDNIVAYWVPSAPVKAKKPLRFSYLLSAYGDSPYWPSVGRVISTRSGSAVVAGNKNGSAKGRRRVVIDFAGGDLNQLGAAQPVQAQLSASAGSIDAVTVERLADNGVWRVSFRYLPDGNKKADMQCSLRLYGDALTETWTYLWTP